MPSRKTLIHGIVGLVIFLTIMACMGIVLLLESKSFIFTMAARSEEQVTTSPFPVSVDPVAKVIHDDPSVNTFFIDALAVESDHEDSFWTKLAHMFVNEDWYQNLASPVGRIVVIWPGERREEATKRIGDILHWNNEDKVLFQALMSSSTPTYLDEGKYFPGQYIAHRYATPAEVQQLITDEFKKEVLDRYTPEVSAKVKLNDALIIASLLEREASDFTNMREVAGVIWNRLFINMPLQLDATLQYIRGSEPYEKRWWPTVHTTDKYLKSPYNTYQNTGLPPAPIANPSTEAILAALNPLPTNCIFYFHTKNGEYLCSPTYEEHVAKLRSLYGRGS